MKDKIDALIKNDVKPKEGLQCDILLAYVNE